jgi:hypothetical protein
MLVGGMHRPKSDLRSTILFAQTQYIDLALGVAGEMQHNTSGQRLINSSIALYCEPPPVGSVAATYAFPNHAISGEAGSQCFSFRPDLYRGRIINIAERRDRTIPHPHYEVDFRIHGAASGGPVFGPSGHAIGVNIREMVGIGSGPAYVTSISLLEGAFIENASLTNCRYTWQSDICRVGRSRCYSR